MSRGQRFPSESRTFIDERTRARIRQVTSHPSIHHPPFYYLQCMDRAQRRLIFVSHRTGRPQLFAEERATGQLLQLTDNDALREWSVCPSHDGRYVYFTAAEGAMRVDCETCEEEVLFPASGAGEGMVGAAMGTTSVSHDDEYWAVPLQTESAWRLLVIETATGQAAAITEHASIGHPEFHPDDSAILRFGGSHRERIWVLNRDGSDKRLVYQRRPHTDGRHFEWIVHETWRPGSREIITASWPTGCLGIDVDTGAVRRVCGFNAWHPAISRQGRYMVADTTFPDDGLKLFDALDGIGAPIDLCLSSSSNVGAHWDTAFCPYDDPETRPEKIYAPQHTHPHPCFSPDGRTVVFTSDASGFAQIYEVDVPQLD